MLLKLSLLNLIQNHYRPYDSFLCCRPVDADLCMRVACSVIFDQRSVSNYHDRKLKKHTNRTLRTTQRKKFLLASMKRINKTKIVCKPVTACTVL